MRNRVLQVCFSPEGEDPSHNKVTATAIDSSTNHAYFLQIQLLTREGEGIAMAEEFACVACGEEAERDDVVLIQECRICRRMHCDGCIDAEGLCVECTE
jgi:hypothetical protein